MEGQLFGFGTKELRALAFQLAERNNLRHPFDKETEMAGIDWLNGFLERNNDLSLRKPEPTSAARAMGFNKIAVSKFFDLFETIVHTHKLTPSRIVNCDEMGLTTVPKSHQKIIATKGRRQVGTLTSAERGQLVTAEICIGADGSYMPPMLIFPRKRIQPELMDGAPPGAWAECHTSGWIQTDIFMSWFKRFITFSRATKESPVLLLLDGHATHTKNLELIDLARESGVILLCFPPHCTHRLQPLDVSFMKPLSTYYGDEVKSWLRAHPGRVVTQYQIAGLFGKAFVKAALMGTAISGFNKTGIWPPQRNVFTEADFLAAETTDIEMLEDPVDIPQMQPHAQQLDDVPEVQSRPVENAREVQSHPDEQDDMLEVQPSPESLSPNRPPEPEPGCSPNTSTDLTPTSQRNEKNSSFNISAEQIVPIPKTGQKKRVVRANRRKTAILTDSPYKLELQQRKEKPKKAKRCLNADEQKKKRVKKTTRVKITSKDTNGVDTECFFCGDLYSRSTEGWIACEECQQWAHCSCAGVDDGEVNYVCDLCN